MKKILIWKCRKCGALARSFTPQDEETYPESKRFYTCNKCVMKEWEEEKKQKVRQKTLF